MKWDTFKKIIDESSAYIQEAALHHRGESLLHPELDRFLSYAARKIPLTKLHTNGTLLSASLREKILFSGLKKLSISFDGFDKEEYEKIRQGADFIQTLKNIQEFSELKKQNGKKFPRIAVEFMDTGKTNSSKKKFLQELTASGIKKIIFKQPHNWAGSVKQKFNKKNYAPCTFLWNALIILYNGDITPCTQDFYAKYVVGNIHHNTLEEIWNNDLMREFRKLLVNNKYQQFTTCAQCDRLWRKTFLGVPIEYLKNLLTGKLP